MTKVINEVVSEMTPEEVWRLVAEGVARQEAQWGALAELIRKTVADPEERERLLNRPVFLPPCNLPRNYVGEVRLEPGEEP